MMVKRGMVIEKGVCGGDGVTDATPQCQVNGGGLGEWGAEKGEEVTFKGGLV